MVLSVTPLVSHLSTRPARPTRVVFGHTPGKSPAVYPPLEMITLKPPATPPNTSALRWSWNPKQLWRNVKTWAMEIADDTKILKITRLTKAIDPRLRVAAAEKISYIPSGLKKEYRDAQKTFLDKLSQDLDESVRAAAAEKAYLADEAVIVRLMNDKVPAVRQNIAKVAPAHLIPVPLKNRIVEHLLGDTDAKVRQEAVGTLGKLFFWHLLVERTSPPDQPRKALISAGEARAIELVQKLKAETDPGVLAAMVDVIGYFGNEAVRQEFEPLLKPAITQLNAQRAAAIRQQLASLDPQGRIQGIRAIDQQFEVIHLDPYSHHTNAYLVFEPAEMVALYRRVLNDKDPNVLRVLSEEVGGSLNSNLQLPSADRLALIETLWDKVDLKTKKNIFIPGAHWLNNADELKLYQRFANSPEAEIRQQALFQLHSTYRNRDPQNAALLRLFFKDPDPVVQRSIRDGLVEKEVLVTREEMARHFAEQDAGEYQSALIRQFGEASHRRMRAEMLAEYPKTVTIKSIIADPALRQALLNEFNASS